MYFTPCDEELLVAVATIEHDLGRYCDELPTTTALVEATGEPKGTLNWRIARLVHFGFLHASQGQPGIRCTRARQANIGDVLKLPRGR